MGLSETDVAKQIQHMIAFIQQEAAEKVEEIEAKAEEEFNIEKSRLVSQQRIKIIEYYDKKEKQIELQRKIQHSNLANASRLSILKAHDDYIQALKEEARKQLTILTQDRTKYSTVLSNLITQGLFLLMKNDVTIRCPAGSVELYAMSGKIKVSNTIEPRLSMIFNQILPEIREKLFDVNQNRKYHD
ncbi:unnamed protein product [Rotaria sp. Silwood2]|nr:unnamed protein product [Rotaria sp. Silwood2]CAF4060947.1 unnamed protein product [Rotaria sp. Silwood2]CAF4121207.1 unnamed protein product [Rotaria sp. Silwood2]